MTKCYQLRCKNNSTLIKVQLKNYKIKINNVNEGGRTKARRTNRKNFHQSSRVFTAKNLETHAPLSTDWKSKTRPCMELRHAAICTSSSRKMPVYSDLLFFISKRQPSMTNQLFSPFKAAQYFLKTAIKSGNLLHRFLESL